MTKTPTENQCLTALIILNYNNPQDTRNCVRSVLKYNSAPLKFIIVDNDSAAEKRAQLLGDLKEIFGDKLSVIGQDAPTGNLGVATLVLCDENTGYACGNNAGLRFAHGDDEIANVMILNNDVLFDSDIIPAMLDKLYSLPSAALISPVLFKRDHDGYDINCARMSPSVGQLISKNLLHYYYRARKQQMHQAYPSLYLIKPQTTDVPSVEEIELPSGSCMLCKKELMQEIGDFDPATFLYFEENILHKKIKALGLKNYILGDLSCIHLGAATTSAMPNSTKMMMHAVRSERYYVARYSGASLPLKWMHWLSTVFFIGTFRLQKALCKGNFKPKSAL